MAARTFDAFADSGLTQPTTSEQLLTGRRAADKVSLGELKHLIFPFVGYDSSGAANDIDTADTFTIPLSGDQVVVRHAWESTSGGAITVKVGITAGLATFLCSANGETGYLHVWISG